MSTNYFEESWGTLFRQHFFCGLFGGGGLRVSHGVLVGVRGESQFLEGLSDLAGGGVLAHPQQLVEVPARRLHRGRRQGGAEEQQQQQP